MSQSYKLRTVIWLEKLLSTGAVSGVAVLTKTGGGAVYTHGLLRTHQEQGSLVDCMPLLALAVCIYSMVWYKAFLSTTIAMHMRSLHVLHKSRTVE